MKIRLKHIIIVLLLFNFIRIFSSEKFSNVDIKNNIDYQLSIQIKKSEYYLNLNDTNANRYTIKALKLAENSSNNLLKIKAYKNFGNMNQIIGDYNSAIKYYNKAKKISNLTKQHYLLADLYKDIGESYRSFFEYPLAIQNLKNAVNLYRKNKDLLGEAKAYNRLAAVFAEFENDSSRRISLEFAENSKKHALKLKYYDLIYSNYLLIGANLGFLKQYKEGLTALNKSLYYCDLSGNQIDKSNIFRNVSIIYFKMKKWDSAIYYGKLAYLDALKSKNPTYLWLSTNILFNIYLNTHNKDSIIKYMGLSNDYRSNIYNMEKDRSAYRETLIYHQNQADFEKAEVKRKSNQITLIFIFTIITIIIILFFLIFRFRLLKKTYNTLNQQKSVIEEQSKDLMILNSTKNKFFSIIAHDLRSPFNSILGLSYELKYNSESLDIDEIKAFASEINKTSLVTYNLLENLLEWAKLQTGAIQPKLEEVEIKTIVENTCDLLEIQALKKNISIKLDKLNPQIVIADENMLTTVLRNIISNAIKFTPKGKSIYISHIKNDKTIDILITDEGIGIDENFIESLFDISKTHSNLGTEKERGTGLGLILCKELIEMQGGKIEVESEINKGSTFKVILPLASFSKM